MSRLYINDLERIVNGKVERYNLGLKTRGVLVPLSYIDNMRRERKYIRDSIIHEFENDINRELDNLKGARIDINQNIKLNNDKLFTLDYLNMTIPTILGDTNCLFSTDGVVVSTSSTSDLDKKVKVIMPYVEKLFELKNKSDILENDFYDDLNIFDDEERVLVMHGGGVFLPFKDYKDLTEEKRQELIRYYYLNWKAILKNILVYNDEVLDRFKPDITKEKTLEIYKGK